MHHTATHCNTETHIFRQELFITHVMGNWHLLPAHEDKLRRNIYKYVHACTYVYISIHVYTQTYICIYICMYIYIYICIHIYIYMYTYTYIYMYVHIHIYIYVYIYVYILLYICMYMHTRTDTQKIAYMLVHLDIVRQNSSVHTRVLAKVHFHTQFCFIFISVSVLVATTSRPPKLSWKDPSKNRALLQ